MVFGEGAIRPALLQVHHRGPEVEQLGEQASATLDHHHVRGLEVPMHDPTLVRGVNNLRDTFEEWHKLFEGHRPVLLKPGGERRALDKLHRDP